MSDENENGRPGNRPPMTLKPRQGSVSAGVVKQSFSHGRTKTVVVETKRTRPHAPASGNLAAPSQAERRHDAPRPQGGGGGGAAGGLSQDEMRARQRAIEAAREAQERQAAERRAADARAAAEAAAARDAAAKA
ncbi:translation initiation factor IF-2, partial [Caulobacter flavus]